MDRSGWGGNKVALRPQLYSNGSTAISKISKSQDLTTKLGALEGQKYDESGGIFCFGGYGGKILIKSASKSAKIGYFSKKFRNEIQDHAQKMRLEKSFRMI